MYWYRVEYRGSWDVTESLRVGYVAAPEDASCDQIKMSMWGQFRLPIASDVFIQIERFSLVEKTVVDGAQGLTNTR